MSTAVSPHPRPAAVPLRTVLSHVALPVLMGLVMALAYLGGFHHPSPNGVRAAVVGPPEQVGGVTAVIQQKAGDALDLKTVDSAAQAQDELKHQEISAAFIPGKDKPELLVASADSDSTAMVVEKAFTAVAAAQDRPLTVTDVVPHDASDPAGQNGFFYLVTLSVGSYAAAIAIGAAGASRRLRERIGILVGTAVATGTVQLALASVLFGMFPGHGGAVWVLSVVYSMTVMAIGVGLHTVVGRFSTLLFSAMFVALNFTSSGGVFQPTLQPGFFGWLHEFWIGSGFIQTITRILYFPDADMAPGIRILAGWVIAAALCLLLTWAAERRRDRFERLSESHHRLRHAVERARTDGLTDEERTALELEEDVAV